MGDQDATPRFHRRLQTSEDRDLAARQPRAKSYPLGIRAYPPETLESLPERGDVTSPYDLLEREADHEVRAVVEKATRNAKDPAYFEDVAKLAVALTRERTGNQQRAHDAEVVLREPSRAAKSSRRHLIAAVIAAAASIAAAAERWSDRAAAAASPGEVRGQQLDEVRAQFQHQADQRVEQVRAQFQHDIDRLDAELRSLRELLGRRSEAEPLVSAGASPALTAITQGPTP